MQSRRLRRLADLLRLRRRAAGDALAPERSARRCSRLLPAYMLPSRWMRFDRLPRNANGKVDRKALKEIFAAGERPRSRAELDRLEKLQREIATIFVERFDTRIASQDVDLLETGLVDR